VKFEVPRINYREGDVPPVTATFKFVETLLQMVVVPAITEADGGSRNCRRGKIHAVKTPRLRLLQHFP